MNDAWGSASHDDLGNTHNDGPKALREAYDTLKQQNEDLNKKLTSFLEGQQKQQLENVFTTLGVPGAASLYQGEPDPEKAKAWVQTMQGVFGTGSVLGDGPVAPTPVQPALTDEQQAQFQRMSEAGQSGVPMGNFEAAQSAVGSATDMASLVAAFQNAARVNG